MGALATARSVACIARDLWKGLNAGTLRYDPGPVGVCESCLRLVGREYPEMLWPNEGRHLCFSCHREADGDLIDEDPPWPVVVWERGGYDQVWAAGETERWHISVRLKPWNGRAPQEWSWSVMLGSDERTGGATLLGEDKAKRRAEEALAVMLEVRHGR